LVETDSLEKTLTVSNSLNRLFKGEEKAKYLRISKSGAYRLMQTGEIPVVKISKVVTVREEDIESFVLNTNPKSRHYGLA
jgi:excisionase family DNA binding protein